MTLNWKTTYFPVLGVNIWQTVRTAVARLPSRQLGFLVLRKLFFGKLLIWFTEDVVLLKYCVLCGYLAAEKLHNYACFNVCYLCWLQLDAYVLRQLLLDKIK